MKTPVPATPVFRDAAGNPYDARALAAEFGGSWDRHMLRHDQLLDAPAAGFTYMVRLSDARVGVLLRNWRNAR